MGRHGVRSEWREVPVSVRAAVDDVLGARVVATEGLVGGFSPGPAVRADLDDGRTVFVKAAGRSLNDLTPRIHRREAEVLRRLPPSVPAPRLLGVVDDGDWVALVQMWVPGRHPVATDPGDVRRLLDLLERSADAAAGRPIDGIPPFADVHADLSGHWVRLARDGDPALDGWSLRHLDRLASLDADAASATVGSHLLHVDVRTDNALLAEEGPTGDVLVDWPGAAIGPAWLDVVFLLPALHLDGGPPPETVLAAARDGRTADPEAIDVMVVAMAGYFTRSALLPPPPGLPTLRPFQAAQAVIARRWAAERLQLA